MLMASEPVMEPEPDMLPEPAMEPEPAALPAMLPEPEPEASPEPALWLMPALAEPAEELLWLTLLGALVEEGFEEVPLSPPQHPARLAASASANTMLTNRFIAILLCETVFGINLCYCSTKVRRYT